jgi:hypothetical protein
VGRGEAHREANMLKDIPVDEWAESLEAFSRRNVGRRVLLEVDDADFGVQPQGTLPLVNVVYDHRDHRIDVVLGQLDGAKARLSRSIPATATVELLTDREGRDRALRIGQRRQQTLLLFLE